MMPENTGNNVNLPHGNLNAGRDIELVGGNQVKIANTTYNLNHFQISNESVSDLFSILERNRKSLNDNLVKIKEHFSKGGDLFHVYAQARIVDAISESRIIESLIVSIKSKGGEAHTLNEEVNVVARIENIISNGKIEYQNYLKKREEEEAIRQREELIGCIGGIFISIGNGIAWIFNQIANKTKSSEQLPNSSNDKNKYLPNGKDKQWWE